MKKNIFIFGLFLMILLLTAQGVKAADTGCCKYETLTGSSTSVTMCLEKKTKEECDAFSGVAINHKTSFLLGGIKKSGDLFNPCDCVAGGKVITKRGCCEFTNPTTTCKEDVTESECITLSGVGRSYFFVHGGNIKNVSGVCKCVYSSSNPSAVSTEIGCCYTRETSTVNTVTLIEKAQIITRSECESLLLNNFNNNQGTRRVSVQFSPNLVVDADGKKCIVSPNKGAGAGSGAAGGASGAGANAGQAFVQVQFDYTGMTNPLNTTDIPTVVGKVVKAILSILGSIFLIMIIYGGFTWMTAMGNDAKVKKGRNILIWAIVGITVIFLAWVLVALVFESINV